MYHVVVAPELHAKKVSNEKVDIFSLALIINEVSLIIVMNVGRQ